MTNTTLVMCMLTRVLSIVDKIKRWRKEFLESKKLQLIKYIVHSCGVRIHYKIDSVDSCLFPYRYDVISPTQLQEVFYSPTPSQQLP